MSRAMYQKRAGTSGIRGQLYETKLISLILYRLKHDDSIEEFNLASNVGDIGVFDDIYFQAKMKGKNKQMAVFIQTIHREYKELNIDLEKYFQSYLQIRERFKSMSSREHPLFQGTFEETECCFVIYTSGRTVQAFDNYRTDSEFASKLNDLIETGGTAKQVPKTADDVIVESLCNAVLIKNNITMLAERVASYILGSGNYEMMLSDDLMLRYHVILAQKVFVVSEILPQGYRIASFRYEFFDRSADEDLNLFKDALYTEIRKRRKIRPTDVHSLLSEILAEPTDDEARLIELMDTIKKYKDELFARRLSTDAVKPDIKQSLLSLQFKVPAAFGNLDLFIRGNAAKREKRLNYLISKTIELFRLNGFNNVINVDETWEKGFLMLNGGLASAIGNVFVLDDNTNMMKITDNWELLNDVAKTFYLKLREQIPNVHEYQFNFQINKFPKLSFGCNEIERDIVRDFLDKLIIYSNQADEQEVEQILKYNIHDDQLDHFDFIKTEPDLAFLKYHDKIQKWWMQPSEASFLTKDHDMFDNVISYAIEDPLLSLKQVITMNKIKRVDYTLTDDVMACLRLEDEDSKTVVVAGSDVLTIVNPSRGTAHCYAHSSL